MKKIMKWILIGFIALVAVGIINGIVSSNCPTLSRELLWRELKEVDDRILETSAIGTRLMIDGVNETADHNIAGMDRVTKSMNANNLVLGGFVDERLSILLELGIE